MYSTVKIVIPIQSISDVITNSSSELFCTIFSDTHLKDIYRFFKKMLRGGDPEYSISISLRRKDEDPDYYEGYPDNWIEMYMPYDYSTASELLELGVKAILDNKFKDYYKIIFDDEKLEWMGN